MAVKRIFKNRLEKAKVAGMGSGTGSGGGGIFISPSDPALVTTVVDGNIWRNTSTNPDAWYIRMSDVWRNMLATDSEHGLMSNTHFSLVDSANWLPHNYALVQYDGSGEVNATGFNSISSRRFKTNISKIQLATETIKQLEGVTFNWKSNGSPDIGLIAEDVFDVVPEVVKVENGIIEGIAYDHLVSILIEGFKEQQEKIDKILNHLGLDNE